MKATGTTYRSASTAFYLFFSLPLPSPPPFFFCQQNCVKRSLCKRCKRNTSIIAKNSTLRYFYKASSRKSLFISLFLSLSPATTIYLFLPSFFLIISPHTITNRVFSFRVYSQINKVYSILLSRLYFADKKINR